MWAKDKLCKINSFQPPQQAPDRPGRGLPEGGSLRGCKHSSKSVRLSVAKGWSDAHETLQVQPSSRLDRRSLGAGVPLDLCSEPWFGRRSRFQQIDSIGSTGSTGWRLPFANPPSNGCLRIIPIATVPPLVPPQTLLDGLHVRGVPQLRGGIDQLGALLTGTLGRVSRL
jgi:hypothetical protein